MLVKTNSFDHQEYLPSLYFDHAIAGYYLDGKLHFLDMTTDFYSSKVLTENDVDAWALLIKPGQKELMRLPNDNLDPELVKMNIKATLNLNRSVNMDVKAWQPGIEAGNIRERFARTSGTEHKNIILKKMGKGVFPTLDLGTNHFDNLESIDDTLRSQYDMIGASFSDKVANLFIFRAPFMTAIQSSPALLNKTRYNRLDLDEVCTIAPTIQNVDVKFPDGYQLIEVPADINIKSKYGEYSVKFKKIKDGIHIEKYQAFYVPFIELNESRQSAGGAHPCRWSRGARYCRPR